MRDLVIDGSFQVEDDPDDTWLTLGDSKLPHQLVPHRNGGKPLSVDAAFGIVDVDIDAVWVLENFDPKLGFFRHFNGDPRGVIERPLPDRRDDRRYGRLTENRERRQQKTQMARRKPEHFSVFAGTPVRRRR